VATNSAGSDTETKTGYINVTAAPSLVTLSYSSFESGIGIWTDGGNDCSRYTSGTYAWGGNAAMNIQDNSGVASSFYLTNGVDVNSPGYVQIDVEFYFIAVSMDNSNEDFWVQYYDGSNWITVADFDQGIDFANNTFYVATVSILESSFTFPSNMKIRFMCDASSVWDDIYIDNITITGHTTEQPSSSFNRVKIINTGINNDDGHTEMYSIYPNPADDILHLNFENPGDYEVFIYNNSGKEVQKFVLSGLNNELNVGHLQNGIYMILIRVDDEIFSSKIFKN
jgi:hypothetical protein